MKILLAHDDYRVADVTAFLLLRDGHAVSLCQQEDAPQRLAGERFDLVLVEGSVPAVHSICLRLRAESDLPIILVADGQDETAIMTGYECGADDVVVRPVGPRHLKLRIAALARRVARAAGTPARSGRAELGDLIVDPARFQARKNGRGLPLTRLELRVLHALTLQAGAVVTTRHLAEHAWESAEGGDAGLLKTHVSHIRRKLAAAGGDRIDIRAVPRTGYILEGHASTGGISVGYHGDHGVQSAGL